MTVSSHDIEAMLRLFRTSGYGEMRVKLGDLSIVVSKDAARRASAAPTAPGITRVQQAPAAKDETAGAIVVRAPVAGTFYRAPSPAAEPFCKPGDRITAETTLGLVEVMKLFTSIQAGVAGTVTHIPAQNGALVEAGQALVLIEPDEAEA